MSAPFVRRHLAFRFLLLGLALAAGLAVYFLSRPVFYSRALVRLGDDAGVDAARTVARELTQPQLLERTASRLGVKVPASELRGAYLFDIAAKPVSAREIEVKVWAHSKQWAELWTEALVHECLDFRRIRRRKEALDAVRALNKEIGDIAEKLGNSGAKKFDATDKAGLVRELGEIDDLRNPAREIEPLAKRIEELGRVRASLLDPAIPIVEKFTLIAAVERAADAEMPSSAPVWETILRRRSPLVELRDAIEFAGTAPDALVLALDDQIGELDRKLQTEFDADFHRFDVDYRNLVDRKAAIEAQAAKPRAPEESVMDQRLGHIAQRIEGLVVGEGTDVGDPAFAGIQEIGDGPVSPNLLKIALVSLVGGGVLAMGVPALAGFFLRGHGNVAQLGSSLGLRALGSVPAIPNLVPRVPVLANAEDKRLVPLVESFRGIRAGLLADSAPPRVLMITSALPGEGKTVVAANLGIAFAESGVRTLVIDTDMRRGRLHRLFGYRQSPGLGNVLAGEICAEKAIRPTPHENLSVLNAGSATAPNTGPLASEVFAQTIERVRESFDLLIFDAPPVLGLPAAAALASRADAVLLVVLASQTSQRAARAAAEVLRARGANVSGLVLNRAAG